MSRPASLLLLAASIALPGCITVAPSVREARPEQAAGLLVEAHASHRLVVPGGAVTAPSRLLLLYVSVEAANGEALVLGPASFRLTLPDQTVAQIFDPPRARVLIERTGLAPMPRQGTEPSPDETPSERIPNGMKNQLKNQLFGAGETESPDSNPSQEGYLVIDTHHLFPSLDGTILEVSVTQEGAVHSLNGAYRFDQPSAAAPLSRLP